MPVANDCISKVPPARDHLAELEGLETAIRYRIHMNTDWLARYVECFRREQTAFILAIRDPESKALVGALPLEIQEVANEQGLKIRQLIPLAGVQSDFGSLLCLPGCERECADRIAFWLADSRQEWDSLRMNILPQSSAGWAELAQALVAAGFSPKVSRDRFFYKVNTDGRWADYEKRFLHRRMDTVRNLINQLTRDSGGMKVERLERGIEDHLGELMGWYRQRRKDAAQKDAFAMYPEKLAFLKSVLGDFESKGLARLSILKAGERVAAYQLDWIDRGIWYYYMPAFNEEFARYSPSKILLYETLRMAFDDPDVHEFNFMRGEESYKAQFADETEAYVSIRVVNPASARARASTLFSRLRALRKRLIRKA